MTDLYRKKMLQPMRPYIVGEDMAGISVNEQDAPEDGGMVAWNPDNPLDQWYVAKQFFLDNYEPAPAPTDLHADAALDVRSVMDALVKCQVECEDGTDAPDACFECAVSRAGYYPDCPMRFSDESEATVERQQATIARLVEDMEFFATWADSYPTSVFHVPDADELKAAHDALKAAGMTLDALSAMVYRHALAHISERARAALDRIGGAL